MSRQPGRRRGRRFYTGSWVTLRVTCASCQSRLGDFCMATSGNHGRHTWVQGPIEQYRHCDENGYALPRGPLKATMTCPSSGCRNAPQIRFEHTDRLLDALAAPGLHRTWRITDTELAVVAQSPELVAAWLRSQAGMIR